MIFERIKGRQEGNIPENNNVDSQNLLTKQ